MASNRWLFILAVSDALGVGHLFRMSELARLASSVGTVRALVFSDWDHSLLTPFFENCDVLPASTLREGFRASALQAANYRGVVVDLLDSPPDLLADLSSFPRRVLLGCSDDRMQWATHVVNVAEGGSLSRRESVVGRNTVVLEGAAFAILREQFRCRVPCTPAPGVLTVLLGGTDPSRLSFPVVSELLQNVPGSIQLIASKHHPDARALISLQMHAKDRLSLIETRADIANILSRSEVAVVSPGNTLFECLALGVPAIAISQNERQEADFRHYPWLLRKSDLLKLPQAINELRQCRSEWDVYVKKLDVGAGLTKLISIFQDQEASSPALKAGVSREKS